MIRIICLIAYLAATAAAVVILDAGSSSGGIALAIWLPASVLLGLASGRPWWSLFAFLAIPFAIPFGTVNGVGEPPQLAWVVFYCAVGSALLILGSAVLRTVIDERRRSSAVRVRTR